MDLLNNETWNHNNVDLVRFEDNMLLIFTWYFIVYTMTSLSLDQHPKHSHKWPNFRFYFNYSNRQPVVKGWCQFVEISILKFNLIHLNNYVSCFPLQSFYAPPLPAHFTTDQSTVEASRCLHYASRSSLLSEDFWRLNWKHLVPSLRLTNFTFPPWHFKIFAVIWIRLMISCQEP